MKVTEVLLNNSALQITYMQFSDHKKQMLVGKYPTAYKELVNAYLYESQERVNNLCEALEANGIKISDLRPLVGLAQDFVASYQLMNFSKEMVSKQMASKETETPITLEIRKRILRRRLKHLK